MGYQDFYDFYIPYTYDNRRPSQQKKDFDLNDIKSNVKTHERYNSFAEKVFKKFIKTSFDISDLCKDYQLLTQQINGEGYPNYFYNANKAENPNVCNELKDTVNQVFKNKNVKNFTLSLGNTIGDSCNVLIKKENVGKVSTKINSSWIF